MYLEQASRKMQPRSQEAAEGTAGGGISISRWKSLEKSLLLLCKTLHVSRMLLVPKEV